MMVDVGTGRERGVAEVGVHGSAKSINYF